MTANRILKKHGHWWLPQGEELGLKWFENERGERPEVIDAALRVTQRRDVALDVGAHVGTWTVGLVPHFAHVHAFEPALVNWMALATNLEERKMGDGRATIWNAAVGERLDSTRPHFASNGSMSSWIEPADKGAIPVVPLDALPFGPVSLIKIDVEGYEYFVLRGARTLIARDHPTLVIEWKTGDHHLNRWGPNEPLIAEMLAGWGYKLAEQMEIDRIYV